MSDNKLNGKRIGLDIDGVLSNFSAGLIKRANKMGLGEHFPKSWKEVTYWDVSDKFREVMKDAWMDEKFWLGLPALTKKVPFKPYCYITSRPIPSEVTERWLDKHGFPKAMVITVSNPTEKMKWIEEHAVDVFVDDLYSTVCELRDAGYNALLYEAPYQRGHVEECKGLPKIKSLDEVLTYVECN